jgi:hypothetical protein
MTDPTQPSAEPVNELQRIADDALTGLRARLREEGAEVPCLVLMVRTDGDRFEPNGTVAMTGEAPAGADGDDVERIIVETIAQSLQFLEERAGLPFRIIVPDLN